MRTCRKTTSFANGDKFFAPLGLEEKTSIASHIDSYREKGAAVRVCLFIMLLSAPSVCLKSQSFFFCQRIGSTYYLKADYSVVCYNSSWMTFMIPAICWLVLYSIGLPLGLFVLLKKRDRIDLSFLHSEYKVLYSLLARSCH